MSTTVYLGVGSNLNRENALRFAVARLKSNLDDFKQSSIYISHAVRNGEPDYYNMVVGGTTSLNLNGFYALVSRIEEDAGREVMLYNGTNFGMKRRLDIDILAFGKEVTSDPCKIPRHDIQDYPFVTCPLSEIAPDFEHPLLNIKVRDLWEEMEPHLPENKKVTKTAIDFTVPAPQWPEK